MKREFKFSGYGAAGAISAWLLAVSGHHALAGEFSGQAAPTSENLAAPDTWTGFFVGANLGGVWRTGPTPTSAAPNYSVRPTSCCYTNFGSSLTPSSFGPGGHGWLGGAEAGYNYQIGKMVVGAETDFALSDLSKSAVFLSSITNGAFLFGTPQAGPPAVSTVTVRLEQFGSVRGRAGVTPTPNTLFYLAGGLAWGHVNASAVVNAPIANFNNWTGSTDAYRIGWTLGAGAEYAITEHLSLEGQYLFYDLGKVQVSAPGQYSYSSGFLPPYLTATAVVTGSIAKLGLNYRF